MPLKSSGMPGRLALLITAFFAFALPASANPNFLTDFQVSDCRGDASYRIGAVITDTGSPHVAIGIHSTSSALNDGGSYPSFSATFPRTHSTSAPSLLALWRGGSGDGVSDRGVSSVNTSASYTNGY